MNLTIRKMKTTDLPSLQRLLSDPDVMRYLEPPYTPEQAAGFLDRCGLSDPPLVYAAEADGQFIGYVIYHDYDRNSVEIGWVLFPEYWNRGYASGLTDLLMDRARKEGKDLVIECDPGQAATKRIAGSHGFIHEGTEGGLEVFRLRLS